MLAGCVTGCAGGPRTPPPEATLREYVSAIRAGDAATAYALLDEDTRAQVTLEELTALLEQNRSELAEQAALVEDAADEGIATQARVELASGEHVRLAREEHGWRITGGVLDAPTLATPQDAVLALRRALLRGSLAGVARILARDQRAELEADIQRFLNETEDELDLDYEVRGNVARVRTTGGREVHLVREAGEWRVVEIR